MYKTAFIGAGNLAWHLAPALEASGHIVTEVYSRDLKNAEALAARLYDASPTDSLDFSDSEAEVFILSVADKAAAEVLAELRLPAGKEVLLLHTSGSLPMSALEGKAPFTGVFYPLQTFSKTKKEVDFSQIPFCLEASAPGIYEVLEEMAEGLTKKARRVSTEERAVLHVAAVIACNFTNHLLAVSQDVLNANGLSFDMLKPLVEETIAKALEIGPENAQTGPAVRGDSATIQKHIDFLEGFPAYKAVYAEMSRGIAEFKQNRKNQKPENETGKSGFWKKMGF